MSSSGRNGMRRYPGRATSFDLAAVLFRWMEHEDRNLGLRRATGAQEGRLHLESIVGTLALGVRARTPGRGCGPKKAKVPYETGTRPKKKITQAPH